MTNNNKFKAFIAIGVVAVGLAAGINQIQDYNQVQEQTAVAACVVETNNVIKKIDSPSSIKAEALNTASGLQAAAKAQAEKVELSGLNAEQVNCNVQEMRAKFMNGVKKVNDKHNSRSFSMTTPG